MFTSIFATGRVEQQTTFRCNPYRSGRFDRDLTDKDKVNTIVLIRFIIP